MIKLLFDVELDEDLSAGEDSDLLENVMTGAEVHDSTREKVKTEKGYYKDYVRRVQWTQNLVEIENSGFRIFYTSVAVISCALLIGMLLFTISFLPRYGLENPEGLDVVRRYVEHGLQETGAINIISGIILDYRAFDTLGESHVLFTALMCVTVLLRIDKKNMRTQYEDFYLIRDEKYHELYGESIMRGVAAVLLPCLFLYGAYVLLNGQNSPGGGFSGGAVVGSGLIICGCQRNRKPYSQRAAWRDPQRRTDPAAGYCRGTGGRMHHVRLLQPVPKRQHWKRGLIWKIC